ncbi:hypothetical protein CVT26_013526 [Gymnopilus dilepis]|uniref:Uncharacterized protein n=1 Tax=Gymnopilus dilepis TaxID=231916 RepID=A0A409Y5H8_9AGAR|nr:hypothetical protein CVT26_013526 [Gymnopilus dilepis]
MPPRPLEFNVNSSVNYNQYIALGGVQNFNAELASQNVWRIVSPRSRATIASLILPYRYGTGTPGHGLGLFRLQVPHFGTMKEAHPPLSHKRPGGRQRAYFLLNTSSVMEGFNFKFEYERRSGDYSLYRIFRQFIDDELATDDRERWDPIGSIDFDRNERGFLMKFQSEVPFHEVVYFYICAIAVLKSGAFKDELQV